MKALNGWAEPQYIHHCNEKYHWTIIWAATFATSLTLKQKKDITIKQHCLLFSGSEPLTHSTQSNYTHTCQADRKAWVDPHRGELTSQQQQITGSLINMVNHWINQFIDSLICLLNILILINMLWFLKIRSMDVPKIFKMKSYLLNMFYLRKLYAIWWTIS